MTAEMQTIVIGAGIGGLTAGALLLRAGHRVTVLEAHVYPGGSAGTFYHQKYRFDAGATLAGGFSPGGPHARVAEILDLEWPVRPADPAWIVHLPDGRTVTQWSDPDRWQEEWLSPSLTRRISGVPRRCWPISVGISLPGLFPGRRKKLATSLPWPEPYGRNYPRPTLSLPQGRRLRPKRRSHVSRLS